jgi:hypothetical protein
MVTPDTLKRQLDSLVGYMARANLTTDQNFAIRRQLGNRRSEITFAGAEHLPLALKDSFYSEIYESLRAKRAYNVLMADGAMIQMSYLFESDELERHRLAFLPSPSLSEFQENSEIYLTEAIYADVVAKGVVPFPIRFDFDCRETAFEEINHPKSHLSLGQYRNCRIPVTAALTPANFIDFVLRHFYHTAFLDHASSLPRFADAFMGTATDAERSIVHMTVPAEVH